MGERKSVADLRAFLATFEPEYPLKKGYIVRLFLGEKTKNVNSKGPTVASVLKMVKTFVQSIEQDKIIDDGHLRSSLWYFEKVLKRKIHNLNLEWSFMVEKMFNEIFPVSFKMLPVSVQLIQPVALTNEPSFSSESVTSDVSQCFSGTQSTTTCNRSPSPKRLRQDCEHCVHKQRTNMNMKKLNASLRKKITALRRKHKLELTTPAEVKRTIKGKDKSIKCWKAKYNNAVRKGDGKYRQVELERQVMDMKVELKESQTRRESLQLQLQELQRQVMDMKVELKESQTRRESLQYQLQELQRKLKISEQEIIVRGDQ